MDIILIQDIEGYALKGASVNVPESIAREWIEKGWAEAKDAPKPPRKATKLDKKEK